MHQTQRPPKQLSLFLLFCPLSNITFPPKKCTTSFPWKCYTNRGFSRFEKLKVWGPKRWNSFLPVLRHQHFWCKNGGVFCDLWPLFLFSLFLLSRRGWQKRMFYRFFCHLPSFKNEKAMFATFFEKPFFGPKHQKTTKTLHTPLKTWFRKIL